MSVLQFTVFQDPIQSFFNLIQAVITSIAALKRRELPDSLMHPSVGTAGDIAAREEAQKKLDTFQLKPSHLQPFVLTVEEMNTWGYVTETPPGVGGDQPSEEGRVMDCERCRQPFKVKAMNEADQCLYHWGRAFTKTHNGSFPPSDSSHKVY